MPSVCFATIRLRRSWESFGFTHHEMILVWHLGFHTPSYRPSVETEPSNINLQWQVSGLLLFLPFLLPPFYHVLNTLFPTSFHIITHNLIYGLHGLFPTSGENFELMNTLCESSVLINSPTEVNEKSLLSSGDTMCVVINASVSPAYVRLLWWGQRSKVRSNIINLLFAHMARRRFKCVDSASFSHRLIIQFCLLF